MYLLAYFLSNLSQSLIGDLYVKLVFLFLLLEQLEGKHVDSPTILVCVLQLGNLDPASATQS